MGDQTKVEKRKRMPAGCIAGEGVYACSIDETMTIVSRTSTIVPAASIQHTRWGHVVFAPVTVPSRPQPIHRRLGWNQPINANLVGRVIEAPECGRAWICDLNRLPAALMRW